MIFGYGFIMRYKGSPKRQVISGATYTNMNLRNLIFKPERTAFRSFLEL